jgi:predicted methyltransferase
MPTEGAPTMLISGIPMHRIKDTDPYRDTLSKIKTIAPITGQTLDTTMGLGYTAIEAAKTAGHVTTIELDPTVLEICRRNPWSQALFDNPRISRVIGDAYDEVEQWTDQSFARIIHDPPTFSLAGDLYSADFYGQLFRLLKAKGRLFHYIGDPKSKSGASVTRGVVRRLQAAGFGRIAPAPQAFGVVAYK